MIYRTGSVCQLYSGKIENNKASGNGGGIYINPSNSGQLRVGNKPLVQNNTVSGKANNVYLPSGKTLTIEIGMSKGASIGVTTANTNYPVAFSNDYKNDYANYFFADDVNAHVEYKDDQKLYLVSGAVPKALTVTFDPNGGTLDEADKTKSLTTGETYGTLPVPNYAGYDFAGWYTEKGGGTEIKENTTVTVFGTQTLYVHWTPIHVHAYTQQVQKPEALKTPADCTNNAVYYLSCACGEVSTNDADTFTAANTALDHDWGEWTQNSDEKTHARICKRDASHTETGNCHGGTADCTHKAVCTVCGGEYGEMAAHSFTAEKAEAQYLKSAATCTEKAIYYKSCTFCGLSSEGTADEATFFSGNALDHDWGAWTQNSDEKTHTRICKRDTRHTETENCHGGTATCTAKAVCTVCGGKYGEVDMTNHTDTTQWIQTETTHTQKYKCCGVIVVPEENHEWKDGVCTECDYECVHQYNWQSENGMYWQHCTICGFDTNKKAIPTIPINGADKVCRTQDYKFSFTLPEGATEATYGYEFIGLGDGSLTPTVEDNLYSGIIKATVYPAEENSLKLIVSAKTADGFEFSAEKTVTIQNEHTGGTAICNDKAKCEVCGESYGELNANNHTDLKHFPAAAATKTAEGNIEYWYCSGCGKYFADKAAAKEITKADTITAKLPEDTKLPQMGDNSNLLLWIALLFISGGAVTATTVYGRKKKRSVK